jgi:hypothetical protein
MVALFLSTLPGAKGFIAIFLKSPALQFFEFYTANAQLLFSAVTVGHEPQEQGGMRAPGYSPRSHYVCN